ncbi:MAG: hypothetical protein FJ024_08495 [Chloroflexi bacterium]|nr:hypothetical protein [Chloroflexota bacterium]
MKQFGIACSIFILMWVIGLVATPVFALSERSTVSPLSSSAQASSGEEIVLDCKYPVISSYAGSYFSWDINLSYNGGKTPKLFDLKVTVPEGFLYTISPGYGESGEIKAIRLDPEKTYPDTVKVTMRSYIWVVPEPGEYSVTVEASSGTLKSTLELKAVVTAKYDLDMEPIGGRFNTQATSGKDNFFKVEVINSGTADVDKIVFSSRVRGTPPGWSITFTPEKIDTLKVGDKREVEVNIKPANKTIAGDYMVNLSCEPEAKNAFASAEIRVTVLTPTVWGWVGVGIVVLVVVGLVFMFMRLGRR